jgi:hypothetical protein
MAVQCRTADQMELQTPGVDTGFAPYSLLYSTGLLVVVLIVVPVIMRGYVPCEMLWFLVGSKVVNSSCNCQLKVSSKLSWAIVNSQSRPAPTKFNTIWYNESHLKGYAKTLFC